MVERKLIYIEWIDSRGCHASWQHLDTIIDDEPCNMQSIGWIIRDTRTHIHLAPHIGDDPEQVCGDMVIPRSAITKRRVVQIQTDANYNRTKVAASKTLRKGNKRRKPDIA